MSYEHTLDLALESVRMGELDDVRWLFGIALDQLCRDFDPIRRGDRLGGLILLLERAGLHELAIRASHAMLCLEDPSAVSCVRQDARETVDATAAHLSSSLDETPLVERSRRDMLHSCLREGSNESPAAASTQLALLMGALGQTQHAVLLLQKSLGELELAPDPELEERTRTALDWTLHGCEPAQCDELLHRLQTRPTHGVMDLRSC